VVTEYAAAIAEELGQSDEFIQMIRIAGLLHDYGKISIPDEILKKDGRLTEAEREIINTHPVVTREILKQVPFRGIYTLIPDITGCHHERWDGQGYPNGIKGEEIPLGARILAVADFFEAITAKRHYRDPMPLEKAIGILKNSSGSHFDPIIVNSFLQYLEKTNFSLIRTNQDLPLAQGWSRSHGCRRRSPRVAILTQVSIRHGQSVYAGNLLNISTTGAYISSQSIVPRGEQVKLTLSLPDSRDYFSIQGVSVWTNDRQEKQSDNHPQGYAIKFVDISDQALSSIQALVRRNIASVSVRSGEILEQKVPDLVDNYQ
jgi:Tfp pilus assembly protein PilZ